jgi:uncharacterized protein with PQ loop repeat
VTIGLLTIAVSVFSLTAMGTLLLQARRIVVRRSSADVSITYFMFLVANMGTWTAYGWFKPDTALFVLNLFGLFCSVVVLAVAVRYRNPEVKLRAPTGVSRAD